MTGPMSQKELEELSKSTDPTVRLLCTFQLQIQAGFTQMSTSLAEATSKLDVAQKAMEKISEEVTTKLLVIEKRVKVIESRTDDLESTAKSHVVQLTRFDKGLTSTKTTVAEQGNRLDGLEARLRNLEQAKSSGIPSGDMTKSFHRIAARWKKQQTDIARLSSRLVVGLKNEKYDEIGYHEMNVEGKSTVQRKPSGIDIKQLRSMITKFVPEGAFFQIVPFKKDGSVVGVKFDDHDGLSGAFLVELVLKHGGEISNELGVWLSQDRPKLYREAQKKAQAFGYFFKENASMYKPYFRFVQSHLVIDDLLICPVFLIPERDESVWKELVKVIEEVCEGNPDLVDESRPLMDQYDPVIFNALLSKSAKS